MENTFICRMFLPDYIFAVSFKYHVQICPGSRLYEETVDRMLYLKRDLRICRGGSRIFKRGCATKGNVKTM